MLILSIYRLVVHNMRHAPNPKTGREVLKVVELSNEEEKRHVQWYRGMQRLVLLQCC